MPKLQHEQDEPAAITPAILYAAKSTQDVRGSIPTQLADGRALAERHGWTVVAEYSDEARSAYHGNRGDRLARAKSHAEQLARDGADPVLIVQHGDRLARGDGVSADHLVEIALWARRAGVSITSVQDPSTFEGGLAFAAMMGDRNHEDSRRKARAVADGLRRKAERGEWVGGILADGYRAIRSVDDHGRQSRRIEKDPARWWIYELIFDLALKGWSDRAIVMELDRRGARTSPRKSTHRPRPFDANRIGQTLRRPCYAALVSYKGEVIGRGKWPAVISPEDFERLQRERRARAHVEKRVTGRPPEGYVLARVGVCGACGARLDTVTGRYIRKDGSRQRTYVCRAHRERPQDCGERPIDAGPVDRVFAENLTTFLGDVEGWRERLVASREAERARLRGEVERAEQDVARHEDALTKARRRWAAALNAGDDAKADAIEEALAHIRAERGQAVRLRDAARDAAGLVEGEVSMDPLIDFFNDLGRELSGRVKDAGGDVKRLNLAVQEFFASVELTVTGGGVEIQPVLSSATTERILSRTDLWHAVADAATIDGHAAQPIESDEEGTVEWSLDLSPEQMREWAENPPEPGSTVQFVVEIDPKRPAALATGGESLLAPLRPPLRLMSAPAGNASSPW